MKKIISFAATMVISDQLANEFFGKSASQLTDAEMTHWIEHALTDEHGGIAAYQSAKVTLLPEFVDPFPEDE